MEIHQLATLRELRDRGSVTAVARSLHLSPSAVSQQLAALQRGAPVPLTRLEGRRLVLTEAGTRLAEASQEVFIALARTQAALASLDGAAREPVGVAAFHSAAAAWFPELLHHAELDVRCTDIDVPAADFVAATGDVDIVIAHRAGHQEAWPRGLEVIPLFTEPLDIALRAGHPSAGHLSRRVLGSLDWIAVHADYPLAAYTDVLAAHADRPLRISHRVNDFAAVIAMLARSDCAALLPRHTSPALGDLVCLTPVDGVRLVRHVDVLMRPEQMIRPAVRAVLDVIRAHAALLTTQR